MKFESLAQKVEREMREKGKVVDMSKKSSYDLDHQLALGLEKIKRESEQKQRASRAYISDVESGRVHFYKKETMYQKVCDYFSSLKKWF